jgi:hypothetical protein
MDIIELNIYLQELPDTTRLPCFAFAVIEIKSGVRN